MSQTIQFGLAEPKTPPGVQEVEVVANPFQTHQPVQNPPQNVTPPPQGPAIVPFLQRTYLAPSGQVSQNDPARPTLSARRQLLPIATQLPPQQLQQLPPAPSQTSRQMRVARRQLPVQRPVIAPQPTPLQQPPLPQAPAQTQQRQLLDIPWLPANLSAAQRRLLTVLGNMPGESVTIKQLNEEWRRRCEEWGPPQPYRSSSNVRSAIEALTGLGFVTRHPGYEYTY
jgi:hypothetical protein